MQAVKAFLLALLGSTTMAVAADKSAAGGRTLVIIERTTMKSQPDQQFMFPIRCDSDGNIYLETSPDPSAGILKLGPKGELLAHFLPSSAADLPVEAALYFSLGATGEVYQVAFPRQGMQRAVLVFHKNGSYDSGIKLDNPPGARDWLPSQVGVFGSGDLLVTGLIIDSAKKISTPFTGVFSSNGQFLRQVVLRDDGDIQKMVEAGDARIVSVNNPYSNRAVSSGQVATAEDGNIYLMRNLSPAIVYAISPGGEVIRRFQVPVEGTVLSMSVVGGKIVVVYENSSMNTVSVALLDLLGHPIATYSEDPEKNGRLGSALACYTDNPERFTFLGTSDDGFLQLRVAEPK